VFLVPGGGFVVDGIFALCLVVVAILCFTLAFAASFAYDDTSPFNIAFWIGVLILVFVWWQYGNQFSHWIDVLAHGSAS